MTRPTARTHHPTAPAGAGVFAALNPDGVAALRGDVPAEAALTLAEVAEMLEKDISTIKRWHRTGKMPRGVQDQTGTRPWRIPVAELVAAGLLHPDRIATVQVELAGRRESREVRDLREQVIRLTEQHTAALALAEERLRTIRILEQVLATQVTQATQVAASTREARGLA